MTAPLPPWPTTPTESDEEDLPRYFDREYPERKARREGSGPSDSPA